MRWTPRDWTRLAALCGFIAVAAGAFAAHGVQSPQARELLRTGSTYGMFHALATLACAALAGRGLPRPGLAAGLFLGGAALFSGSLYALALGAPAWAGAITPVGGALFLAGWAWLIFATGRAWREA